MLNYSNISVNKLKQIINENDVDKLVSIVYDIPDEELDIMDMDEYTSLVSSLKGLKVDYNIKFNHIKIDDYILYYKPITSLTYGEFLDINAYVKLNKIEYLYAIFFRLKIEDRPFSTPILEDYKFDINHRAGIMINQPAIYWFRIKSDIIRLNEIVKKRYSVIFEDDDVEVEFDETITDARVKAQYLHEQKIKQAFSKNAWEYTTHSLAGGDVTKYDEVYNTPLFICLNSLKLSKDLELKNQKTNIK